MKHSLTYTLLAATALVPLAAFAAGLRQDPSVAVTSPTENMLLRVESSDDDHGTLRLAGGEDDEGCGSEDDDKGQGCSGGGPNPPPAGTIAPPSNGLFGNGKAPTVQSN
jgi:hypothetical protein